MGTKILDVNGGGKFAPTALMKEEGKMIKGTLLSRREVETMYGAKPVYKLKVQDASCDFSIGKGENVTPAAGEEVDLFASTRLERQLLKVPFGSTVTITHMGKKKFGRGQPAHVYDVEIG